MMLSQDCRAVGDSNAVLYECFVRKVRGERRQRRHQIVIRGVVQGVGFRRSSSAGNRYEATGWVSNSPQGVFIEVKGSSSIRYLPATSRTEKPRSHNTARIITTRSCGRTTFEIRTRQQAQTTLVLPDIATCRIAWKMFSIRTATCTHLPTVPTASWFTIIDRP
jgi:acylphosphatase